MPLEQAGLEWLNKNLPGFLDGLGKANRGMAGVGDSAERSGGKVDVLGSVLTGFATAAANVAFQAVQKVTGALIELGASSIDVAGEFQSQMAVLGIAAKSAGLSIDELHDAALEVGGDISLVGVSAVGAADSMTGLYKAGLTTTEIFGDLNGYMEGTAELGGALRASIDLAAASELDMVQASDLAAITLATFGSELETAEERADFITGAMNNFVQAADASVAEVSGLADAMTNVGPTAAAFGFSLEETNNALAVLSTRGIQGSEAGTALKSMLTNILRTTDPVVEALNELGISLYDDQGNMLSLVEIIGQFQVAMEGMTEKQKNQYIQTLAGTYGMKTMQTLLAEGVEGWYAMADATENAATIQEGAAAKASTYAGQMEALEGTLETLKIQVGEALLPTLTDLAGMFMEFVDKHGAKLAAIFEAVGNVAQNILVPALEHFITRLEAGHSPLSAFLTALRSIGFDDIANAISRIIEPLELMGPAFRQAGQIIQQSLGVAFQTLTEEAWPQLQEAFGTIKDALAELGITFDDSGSAIETVAHIIAGAVGVIASVISGLASVINSLAQTWANAVSAIKGIIEGFAQWFAGAMEAVQGLLTGDFKRAGKGFVQQWKGIFKFVKNIVKLIVNAILMPFKAVYKFIEKFIKGIIKFFEKLKKELVGSSIIPDMMKKIQDVIEGTLEAIARFVERILNAIAKTWERIFNAIASVTEKVFDAIEKVIDTTMKAIENIIDRVTRSIESTWKSFTATLERVWNNFTDTIERVWNAMWDAVENVLDNARSAIESTISNLVSAVESAWGNFTDTLEQVWDTVWSTIETALDNARSAIESTISNLVSAVENAWNTFTDNIETMWSTAWDNITSAVSTAWDNIRSAVEDGIDNVISTLEDSLSTMYEKGEDIVNNIKDGIEDTWDNITDAISDGLTGTRDSITSAITNALDTIKTKAKDIVTWMKDGIVEKWSDITSTITTNLNNIGTAIAAAATAIKNAGKNIITRMIGAKSGDNVGGLLGEIWRIFTNITSEIRSNITTAVSNSWAKLKEAGAKIIDGIIAGIARISRTLANALARALGRPLPSSEPKDPQSPFRSKKLKSSGEWIGARLVEGIQEGLAGMTPTTVAVPNVSVFVPPVSVQAPQAASPAQISIGPNYISDEMDMAVFEARVRQVVAGAIP